MAKRSENPAKIFNLGLGACPNPKFQVLALSTAGVLRQPISSDVTLDLAVVMLQRCSGHVTGADQSGGRVVFPTNVRVVADHTSCDRLQGQAYQMFQSSPMVVLRDLDSGLLGTINSVDVQ